METISEMVIWQNFIGRKFHLEERNKGPLITSFLKGILK